MKIGSYPYWSTEGGNLTQIGLNHSYTTWEVEIQCVILTSINQKKCEAKIGS